MSVSPSSSPSVSPSLSPSISPSLSSSAESSIYVDLSATGTGNSGTSADPYSVTEFLSDYESWGSENDIYYKGAATNLTVNVGSAAVGNIHHKWSLSHDPVNGSDDPWIIKTTGNITLLGPMSHAMLEAGGDIITGEASLYDPVNDVVGSCIFIAGGDFEAILDNGFTTYKGCTIICDVHVGWDSSTEYRDCIFQVTDQPAIGSYYNCVTNGWRFGSGGEVVSQCQVDWPDSIGISVTDPKDSWYIGHFDKNITTPPIPGNGSPNYVGYDLDPWGYERDNIGGFSFERAATSSPSASVSPSVSQSASPSPSVSESVSPSLSPSVSESISPSVSESISPSLSPSVSESISPSVSESVSPSLSPSVSESISSSVSESVSPSLSPSVSESISSSVSESVSPSISPSVSESVSPSLSPSVSESLSPSISPSVSESASPSVSPDHPAESCIRNLIKFDDMLVMMTSPDINSGLIGYRAGQKIENVNDFIDFLGTVPSYVYLNTYLLEENFDDGTIHNLDFWDGNISSKNDIAVQSDGDGMLVSKLAYSYLQHYIAQAKTISGDFELEIGFKCGDVFRTGAPTFIVATLRYGTGYANITWGFDISATSTYARVILNGGAGSYSESESYYRSSNPWVKMEALKELKFRIKRTGSVLKGCVQNATTGVWIESVTATELRDVESLEVRFYYNTPGISYIRLQADSGLTYSRS